MNDYDNWKLETPKDEPENTCMNCGAQCDDNFCSIECEKADRQ